MNPLFSALESVFEEEGSGPSFTHEPLTIRTVVRLLEAWSPGDSPNPAVQLNQMRDRVCDAARQTEGEQGQDRDAELQAHLQDMLDIYREMAACLQAAGLAVEAQDESAARAQATLLAELRARLQYRDSAVNEWMTRPILRCPRCGRPGSGRCDICSLELLYNDPSANQANRSTQLGPEYTAAYEAWHGVVSGEVSLSALWPALDPLEALLRRYLRMTQQQLAAGMAGERVRQLLEQIALASQESLEGVAQMRSAARSHQMKDLHEGWTMVFEQAVRIQDCLPGLARAIGGKQEPTAIQTHDALNIDFD